MPKTSNTKNQKTENKEQEKKTRKYINYDWNKIGNWYLNNGRDITKTSKKFKMDYSNCRNGLIRLGYFQRAEKINSEITKKTDLVRIEKEVNAVDELYKISSENELLIAKKINEILTDEKTKIDDPRCLKIFSEISQSNIKQNIEDQKKPDFNLSEILGNLTNENKSDKKSIKTTDILEDFTIDNTKALS